MCLLLGILSEAQNCSNVSPKTEKSLWDSTWDTVTDGLNHKELFWGVVVVFVVYGLCLLALGILVGTLLICYSVYVAAENFTLICRLLATSYKKFCK